MSVPNAGLARHGFTCSNGFPGAGSVCFRATICKALLLQRRPAYPRLRGQTPDPSGAPTPPNPEHPGSRAQAAFALLSPSPSFTFNMGRLACEELTLVSPGFLSRNCFLALTVFCHSFFCHSSAATALPALVRFWLSAPEGPRHLQSH